MDEEELDVDAYDECALCIEALDYGVCEGSMRVESLVLCGHCFHVKCVTVLVEHCSNKGVMPLCPMCRANLVRAR